VRSLTQGSLPRQRVIRNAPQRNPLRRGEFALRRKTKPRFLPVKILHCETTLTICNQLETNGGV
jgi:hypothetical protein